MSSICRMVVLHVVLISASVLVPLTRAQSGAPPVVAAYAEAFGNTGLASVNMDLLFRDRFLFRFGGLPTFADDSGHRDGERWKDRIDGVLLVVMGGIAAGEGPVRIETGLGLTFGMRESADTQSLNEDFARLTVTIGLRHQPPQQPIMFRIGFTPRFSTTEFQPGLGFSLGLTLDEEEW